MLLNFKNLYQIFKLQIHQEINKFKTLIFIVNKSITLKNNNKQNVILLCFILLKILLMKKILSPSQHNHFNKNYKFLIN